MFLADARKIALALRDQMAPHCDQIEIACSIRRRVAAVKDIEIVLVPKSEERTAKTGLFDDEIKYRVNLLHSWATNWDDEHGITWIKPGTNDVIEWKIEPDGKYWRGYLPQHDIKLDIFLVKPESFGIQLLIRTGCAEFSQAVVTHANRIGRPSKDGCLHIAGVPVETFTEEDAFSILGLQFVPPEKRANRFAVKEKPEKKATTTHILSPTNKQP